MTIAQGLLPFHLIEDPSGVLMTSFRGLPLVMETFRALGLPQSIAQHLPLHKRPSKYEEADYVESYGVEPDLIVADQFGTATYLSERILQKALRALRPTVRRGTRKGP